MDWTCSLDIKVNECLNCFRWRTWKAKTWKNERETGR